MTEREKSALRRIAGFTLKVLLSAAIIGGIVWFHRQEVFAALRNFSAPILLFALPVALIPLLAGTYRWQQLAAVVNLKMRFAEAFSLTMQGNFFSLVIPAGAIGGDLVKIGMVSRRSLPGHKIDGTMTVLMDRLIGMLALFALGIAAVIAGIPLLMKLSSNRNMNLLIILFFSGVCVAGIGGGLAVFAHRKILKIPFAAKIFTFADTRSGGVFSRMCAAIDLYAGARAVVVKQLLSSLFLIHLMPALLMALIFCGFGLPVVWHTVTAAAVLGNIAGLLPVFPGGIGGRDVTAIALLTAGGIPPGEAAAAQLCCTAAQLFFTLLLGGGAFISDGGQALNYGKKGEDQQNGN